MQTKPTTTRVAIIGGGIAGLSTAWHLQKEGVPYALLEASARWGGKVLSDRVDGYGDQPFIIEGGPDSFYTQKPWAGQLAAALGLSARLDGTNDDRREVYVVNKGRPTKLPDGVLLIIPTRIMPFALSPLISPLGKLRMGLDLLIPAKRDGQDETLAQFIRRRLGAEALDKIAEPLMSGIHNAEAERQSVLATFPRFRAMEEKYGSLTRGMLAAKRMSAARKAAAGSNGSGPPKALFQTMRGGLAELTDALAGQLSGDLRLESPVERLEKTNGHYQLTLDSGEHLLAGAVVLALPAYTAADLLAGLAPDVAEQMRGIRYVSTGTMSLAYRQADLAGKLDGFGLLVPRSEQRPINAITWTSTKFPHRAPEGYALLRVFFGGSRSPESMKLNDDDLLATVLSELKSLLDIDAAPLFHRVYRWHKSNPQYDVGHLERVAVIEAGLPAGLFVTGSPYRGVGLPDCVKQAQETAQQIVDWL